MFRAALFDLDGTLIDSLGDIIQAVNALRAERNLPPWQSEAIRNWVGQGAEYLIRGAVPELRESEVPAAAQRYVQHYLHLGAPTARLYPGVVETLRTLKRHKIKIGIVTNKATVSAEAAMRNFLPDIAVDCVAGPERVSGRKPNPAHILEVLQRLQVSREDAFYVGDDPVDAECARAADVKFFAAVYGIGGVQASPDQALENFPALLGKLSI